MHANKLTSYAKKALVLGAAGMLIVACTDDDGDFGLGGSGAGGTEAKGGTSGKGGASGAAGRNVGGSSAGESSAGADPVGGGGNGAGGSSAGNGAGGKGGSSGMGGGITNLAGEGGMGGEGGAAAGAGGMDEAAGMGGSGPVIADTLDNANFDDGGNFSDINGWLTTGDADADKLEWTNPNTAADGNTLKLYKATAFQVTQSQVLDPLPDGTYSFSIKVQRPANLISQYLFAKGCNAADPTTQVTQVTDVAGSSVLTTITLSGIVVSSGKCTVGIYTDAPAGGWSNIDDAEFIPQPL